MYKCNQSIIHSNKAKQQLGELQSNENFIQLLIYHDIQYVSESNSVVQK